MSFFSFFPVLASHYNDGGNKRASDWEKNLFGCRVGTKKEEKNGRQATYFTLVTADCFPSSEKLVPYCLRD